MKPIKSPVFNKEIAKKTAQLLIDTDSYLVDFNRPVDKYFKWKSGVISPTYCNCRYLLKSYEAYSKITKYLEIVREEKFKDIKSITGIAASGIPWSSQLALTSKLPMSFVRSKLKNYGVGRYVDCKPLENTKVVIIDDLCSSGESIYQAKVALLEEYNINAIGCITIVNWGFDNMWNRLGDMEVYSLVSFENLLEESLKRNSITQKQSIELLEFYRNPFEHIWK